MSKVVGAVSLSLVLASAGAAWSQEIGKVSVLPNAATGELVVQTPVRPDGETVYIVRNGTLVTDARIASSGQAAGTLISLPAGAAAKVQVGDSIALAPPAGTSVTTTQTTKVTATEVGAPEPALAPATAVAVSVPAAVEAETSFVSAQLEKGSTRYTRTEVTAAIAEPTPRGMGVPVFPAPAKIVTEAGIIAPYGQGLAAAAPVGTPYLRSPAFAGPPTIYMPQTVTRVLLPGATPYPSNIMSPPTQYVYASAPFLRTDIYTSLPYGTFYWPQGYAGTTPVEPQVPAYVTAPASAILSTEADYSAGRYVPGVANEETLNPITAGINSNLVASTTLSSEQGGTAATVQAVPSLTIAQPGLEAAPSAEAVVSPVPVDPFPVMSDGAAVSATTTSVATEPLGTLPTLAVPTPAIPTPAPAVPTPVMPTLPAAPAAGTVPALPSLPPDGASALPTLPAASSSATPAAGLPTLPAANAEVAGLPTLPAAGASTPASMVSSLPQVATSPATQIIVDDKTPGGLTLNPADAWVPSASTESYENSSLIATVDPAQVKTATFNATIPADGLYEVALSYVGAAQFRSNAVPVTIHTATGEQQATVDQTQTGQWHVIGNYQFKAGQNVPVVTLSTAGLEGAGSSVSVSADAVRLTPVS